MGGSGRLITVKVGGHCAAVLDSHEEEVSSCHSGNVGCVVGIDRDLSVDVGGESGDARPRYQREGGRGFHGDGHGEDWRICTLAHPVERVYFEVVGSGGQWGAAEAGNELGLGGGVLAPIVD